MTVPFLFRFEDVRFSSVANFYARTTAHPPFQCGV